MPGPYEIVHLLGSGGGGDVFLARRTDPFHQHVAVKILRPRSSPEALRRRFDAERTALGALEHPNIARLLATGWTDDAHPWLAVELVPGARPLDAWCREVGASARQRVQKLVAAAEAVQHAHGRLVVHGDLKPSNLLVADDGRLKVIDFGVARRLDETAGALEMLTREYAAPEQRLGEPPTTASDVFSLGLVLLELLTGRRADRPVRPRDGEIDHDLTRIVACACHEDPERRYASAGDLADDLQRYLDARPLRVRPDTWAYRTRLWARRRPAAAGAMVLAVVAWLALGASIAALTGRLEHERDQALVQRDRAEHAVDALVELLRAGDPVHAPQADPAAVHQFLVEHEARVLAMVDRDPSVRARVQQVLGQLHLERHELEAATHLLGEAWDTQRVLHGEQSAAALVTRRALGLALHRAGDPQGVDVLRSAADGFRQRFGDHDPRIAKPLQDLALALPQEDPGRRALLEEAVEIQRQADVLDPVALASAQSDLANDLFHAGEVAHAVEIQREVVPIAVEHLGEAHPHTAIVLGNLAVYLSQLGQQEEAEGLLRRVLAAHRGHYGDDHGQVANARLNLAVNLTHQHRRIGAEAELREALRIYEALHGPEHPQVALVARSLAALLYTRDRHDKALVHALAALQAYEATLGPDGRLTSATRCQLALQLLLLDRPEDARPHAEQALAALREAAPAEGHRSVAICELRLARIRLAEGRREEATALARSAESWTRSRPGMRGTWIPAQLILGLAESNETGRARIVEHLPEYRHFGLMEARLLAQAEAAIQKR